MSISVKGKLILSKGSDLMNVTKLINDRNHTGAHLRCRRLHFIQ